MKNYKLLSVLFMFVFLTQSCGEGDLELSDPNNLSPDTFFADETQVESSVVAAYTQMQTIALYTRYLFFMYDNMAQENQRNPQLEADKVIYLNYSYQSSNAQIANFWDSCFRGVNKANFVISNEEKINAISNMSDEKKKQYIAEARFLRGHYYFLLVTRFGDVPLFDALPDGRKGKPRSPKEEVWKQITEDFRYGSENLPDKANIEKGHATKGAALAYLGKVLLYQKKYAEALTAFNKISGYSLEPDFYDNFKEETEHGPESFFEVEFNVSAGTADKWGSEVQGNGFNEITFRGQEYGCLDWFNVAPSNDLLDEFEEGDIRKSESFYFPGDTYSEGTITQKDLTVADGPRRAGWRKYQNYYKQKSENQESGINFKVLRYADVLLMMAECANETGDQATAINLIDQVRERAGLDGLDSGLSQDQVFTALVHERKVELAGEQVRFDDILRWGIADQELAGTKFQKGKNELWPIPDKEISANDAITTADQNPGY